MLKVTVWLLGIRYSLLCLQYQSTFSLISELTIFSVHAFSDCTCLMFLILQSQPFILETLPIHYQCCSTCISVLFLLLSFSYFCNSSPGLFPLLFYLISCVFSELYLILKFSLNTIYFFSIFSLFLHLYFIVSLLFFSITTPPLTLLLC